jgi:sugar lactone lactonase YvrE
MSTRLDLSGSFHPAMRVAAAIPCLLCENPLWHNGEQRLYWRDIDAGRLYWHDPATGISALAYEAERKIGGFTIEDDGAILLFMDAGRVERWQHGKSSTLVESDPRMLHTRFNDIIADSAGRVFCGTMSTSDHPGTLYRLDAALQLTSVLGEVGCSNGMAFDLDGETFFHTDSFARVINKFRYDAHTGEIDDPKVFAHTKDEDGLPDGLTMDAEGCLLSAHWDGGFVVRFSPAGDEIERILMPVQRPTSVAFGGDDLRMIFITSAAEDLATPTFLLEGNLFAFSVSVRGLPEYRSRIYSHLPGDL